jgi:murein DD-endopeptidase MepM/ murein hydrolase activator NlpD
LTLNHQAATVQSKAEKAVLWLPNAHEEYSGVIPEKPLRRRYYIIFVAREKDGPLRKIPIPLHYAAVFVAAAVVGAFTITGMAGSYTRMLLKTASFDQVRSQQAALRRDYSQLQIVAHEKDVQAASLGSLASEVSALYGLRRGRLSKAISPAAATTVADTDDSGTFTQQAYAESLDQFAALRSTALSGRIYRFDPALAPATNTNWVDVAGAPELWPVTGRITSSFGEREDPILTGEGEFHTGIDIAASFGAQVHAAADGVVEKAGWETGYGRVIIVSHGNGIETLYAHLSGFVVTVGQQVQCGQVIGYVGLSGRTTGPNLHYEVRIHNTPVNPHKYLRETLSQLASTRTSSDIFANIGN